MSDAQLGKTIIGDGDGGVPEVFSPLAEVIDVSGPGLATDDIEVTNQDSPDFFKEYIPGLIEGGEISFDVNLLPKVAANARLVDLQLKRTVKNWEIQWTQFGSPNPTMTLPGYVKGWDPTSPNGDKATSSITIKVAGKPALTNWTFV